MTKLVVFGWGNEARGDDALGALLLRRIARWGLADVDIVEDYQLQIEHALDLVGAEAALFLDASRGLSQPFAFRETFAEPQRLLTTHVLAPEAVLDVYAVTVGKPPPAAFVLAMRGERFALGEGLSAAGEAALREASVFCEALLADRSLTAWRRAANGSSLAREAAVP